MNHTFSICAYGDSCYLDECINSLLPQRDISEIVLCTSTPSKYIETLCKQNSIEMFINDEPKGIASDWNFAIKMAQTKYVTIAHQDDVYCSNYSSKAIELLESCNNNPLIFFSDYGEIRDARYIENNRNLRIKRMLLRRIKKRRFLESRKGKRDLLRFGSAISCPSVTYNKSAIPFPLFHNDYRCDLDWQAWERLSILDGSFCFSPDILMYHRIHEDSETSNSIKNKIRTKEDLEMLEHFWTKPVAKLICDIYAQSENSNKLD